jgi:hypothetical protein
MPHNFSSKYEDYHEMANCILSRGLGWQLRAEQNFSGHGEREERDGKSFAERLKF